MSVMQWVLLGLALVLVFWAVGAYNRLVRLKNAIANAFGQIDVQLKRRYDLIPNLVEVARRYLAHESQTLEAVIAATRPAAPSRWRPPVRLTPRRLVSWRGRRRCWVVPLAA